ncbi:hypothetical protein [Kitasatospora indigofera]|uniref:hypothetical protein n=1 Tax=Kitasatospora indigofera TaxID=67307 RepID=UPI00339E3EB2
MANANARFPSLATLLHLPESEPEFETFDGNELTSAAVELIPGATATADGPDSWTLIVDSVPVTIQNCHAGLYAVYAATDSSTRGFAEARGTVDISNTPALADSAQILAHTVTQILNSLT